MAPRLAAKMVVKPKKRSAQDESDARKPKKPTVTTVKPRITASKSTGTAGNPTVIAGDATVTRIKTEDLMMISTAFQHENTQAILDVFDEFRKRGIDDEVSLPCVVVGGDTSSGKSSVMERLTGIAFPSGEDVVTRFATEVAMRPADVLQVLVTIIPGDGRNATERLNLRRFVKKLNSIAEYPDAHAEAAKVMGLTTKKTAIVGDPLRVDIRGPGITPLTLVDLPGLIHATTATTTEADKKLSSTLLHRYLNNPRTIILCVVSAINDFVMQEITSLARKVDPEGKRTMGLITKPDVAVGIPQKEQQWMDLIQNENIKLHLGWHGLVNKVSNQASATASEVDKNEAAFFSHDRFSGLPASILGLAALKPRINTIVHTTLLDALPDLKDQFKMKLEKALKDLKGLGHSRSNANARKTFMILMSNDFTAKATSAVFGHYNSPWFEQESMRGSQKVIKTLRSEIHRLHDDFALGMRLHGATYRIEGSTTINIAAATFSGEDTPHSYDWADKGKDLTDKDAVDWVLQELPKFRGSELSGEVNSDLVDRLFRDRSENWQVLSEEHVSTVFSSCEDASDVSHRIMRWHINPVMQQARDEARLQLDELSEDEKSSRTTHNPLYVILLQQAREGRKLAALNKPNQGPGLTSRYPSVSLSSQILAISAHASTLPEADANKTAAEETLVQVLASYATILNYYIDAVIKQVIERTIVKRIPDIMSTDWVLRLDEAKLDQLAAEPATVRDKRHECEKTKERMEYALKKFKMNLECL